MQKAFQGGLCALLICNAEYGMLEQKSNALEQSRGRQKPKFNLKCKKIKIGEKKLKKETCSLMWRTVKHI